MPVGMNSSQLKRSPSLADRISSFSHASGSSSSHPGSSRYRSKSLDLISSPINHVAESWASADQDVISVNGKRISGPIFMNGTSGVAPPTEDTPFKLMDEGPPHASSRKPSTRENADNISDEKLGQHSITPDGLNANLLRSKFSMSPDRSSELSKSRPRDKLSPGESTNPFSTYSSDTIKSKSSFSPFAFPWTGGSTSSLKKERKGASARRSHSGSSRSEGRVTDPVSSPSRTRQESMSAFKKLLTPAKYLRPSKSNISSLGKESESHSPSVQPRRHASARLLREFIETESGPKLDASRPTPGGTAIKPAVLHSVTQKAKKIGPEVEPASWRSMLRQRKDERERLQGVLLSSLPDLPNALHGDRPFSSKGKLDQRLDNSDPQSSGLVLPHIEPVGKFGSQQAFKGLVVLERSPHDESHVSVRSRSASCDLLREEQKELDYKFSLDIEGSMSPFRHQGQLFNSEASNRAQEAVLSDHQTPSPVQNRSISSRFKKLYLLSKVQSSARVVNQETVRVDLGKVQGENDLRTGCGTEPDIKTGWWSSLKSKTRKGAGNSRPETSSTTSSGKMVPTYQPRKLSVDSLAKHDICPARHSEDLLSKDSPKFLDEAVQSPKSRSVDLVRPQLTSSGVVPIHSLAGKRRAPIPALLIQEATSSRGKVEAALASSSSSNQAASNRPPWLRQLVLQSSANIPEAPSRFDRPLISPVTSTSSYHTIDSEPSEIHSSPDSMLEVMVAPAQMNVASISASKSLPIPPRSKRSRASTVSSQDSIQMIPSGAKISGLRTIKVDNTTWSGRKSSPSNRAKDRTSVTTVGTSILYADENEASPRLFTPKKVGRYQRRQFERTSPAATRSPRSPRKPPLKGPQAFSPRTRLHSFKSPKAPLPVMHGSHSSTEYYGASPNKRGMSRMQVSYPKGKSHLNLPNKTSSSTELVPTSQTRGIPTLAEADQVTEVFGHLVEDFDDNMTTAVMTPSSGISRLSRISRNDDNLSSYPQPFDDFSRVSGSPMENCFDLREDLRSSVTFGSIYSYSSTDLDSSNGDEEELRERIECMMEGEASSPEPSIVAGSIHSTPFPDDYVDHNQSDGSYHSQKGKAVHSSLLQAFGLATIPTLKIPTKSDALDKGWAIRGSPIPEFHLNDKPLVMTDSSANETSVSSHGGDLDQSQAWPCNSPKRSSRNSSTDGVAPVTEACGKTAASVRSGSGKRSADMRTTVAKQAKSPLRGRAHGRRIDSNAALEARARVFGWKMVPQTGNHQQTVERKRRTSTERQYDARSLSYVGGEKKQ